MQPERYQQACTLLNSIVDNLYERSTERAYGMTPKPGIIKTAAGPAPIDTIEEPATAHNILSSPGRYSKAYGLVTALGNSRFNTNGAEWQQRRDLTQPLYVDAARRDRRERIEDVYHQHIANIQPTAEKQPGEAFLQASLSVFLEALGCDQGVDELVPLFDQLRRTQRQLQFLSWIPAPSHEIEASWSASQEILQSLARIMLEHPTLQRLKTQLEADGKSIGHFSAVEEFLMNMFAGVETNYSTLLWCLEMLGRHPAIQTRIYDEVMTAAETPLLDAFIKETMRCYPSIPFVVRRVDETTELDGMTLQQGRVILISIIGVHRHSDYWDRPLDFDPERSEFLEDRYDRQAFIPFITGQRMCGGAKLARMELHAGLKALVQHFEITSSGGRLELDYALAMRPVPATRPRLNVR